MQFVRLTKSVLAALLFGLLLVTLVQAEKEEDVTNEKGDVAFGDDEEGEGDAGDDDGDDDTGDKAKEDKGAVINVVESYEEYRTDKPEGLSFIEDFQEDWEKTWIHSKNSVYGGLFKVGTGANPEIPGDKGLIIPLKARHYGISALVPGLSDLTKDDFVVQYEVRMDEGMTCGGAYLKLPTSEFADPAAFDNSVRYSVMFGPDKCGSTDKVHFIFQSKNPKTGKFTEHHLKAPPSVPSGMGKTTHLYTLIVRKDKTFEILIDSESKKKGSLDKDFEPPVQPLEEIDDENDTKPDTWVDVKKIADPDAKKPDDWDEDEPKEIPDEDATKPEDWDEDMPKEIPDPEATKPEEWDDEEDGDWVPKMIPNPDCKTGCGPWKRPMKKNPKYKGKWSAPMIDNPEYKGEWKPRKIANPEYYKVDEPSLLGIGGVGIEVWTMDQGVVFDNIVLGTDVDAAKTYALSTWKKKSEVAEQKKKEQKEKEDKLAAEAAKASKSSLKFLDRMLDKFSEIMEPIETKLTNLGMGPIFEKIEEIGFDRPMLLVITMPLGLTLMFILARLFGGKTRAVAPADAEAKKTDKPTRDDKSANAKDSEEVANESEVTPLEDKSEGATTAGMRKRKVATAE
eukprot:Plantae.Rhodophyta-Hildenbrandia_rubra.ctg3281.p1 GENE.Plantae.Rhodophyta-Hildenbrandia_rubra.ctg3281~~Plantae.Rhodophyta-Hildenbrandia_rubra.ctg3281.p1  ORF type:complete len:621 (-),score=163.38 Plantae.Rhodophyta-Hildenbrandia_rubra.ctg3281:1201-3063(-)